MTVGYNGLFLSRPRTGTGQHSRYLLEAMARRRPDQRFVVAVPAPVEISFPGNVEILVIDPSRPWLGRGLALDRWEAVDVSQALKGLALYHTPYPTPPPAVDVPVVMTVHDAIPLQFPQYLGPWRSRWKHRRVTAGIKSADVVLTVSESAKRDIVRHYGIPNASVTYDGIPGDFLVPVAAAERKSVLAKYGLTRPYVLYIGGFDYRKNVRRLVEAFGRAGLQRSHDLVLAGALTAPPTSLYRDFRDLPKSLKEAGISRQTQRLGFVDEREKLALLAGADSFVFPSLGEGFGLPILEALAVGTPVAASDIPATKELFGQAVMTFDPLVVSDQAKALREATLRPDDRRRQTGQRLARRFSWDQAADLTLQEYDRLLK